MTITDDILDDMRLPSVNERRSQSEHEQRKLSVEIRKAILDYQHDTGYVFESFEISNVLLGLLQSTHESYLSNKFGEK